MEICFPSEIYSFPSRSIYDYNDSFHIEYQNYCESNVIKDALILGNNENNQTFWISPDIFPFTNYQNKNEDEITNAMKVYFLEKNKSNANNENVINEFNLANLETDKSKSNQMIEIKKELPPKFFPENAINVIIRNYYDISKELKIKLLLDTNIKNNDIEQIKIVVESDTKKRRKRFNNDLYRTDHILGKLINIINLSLLNFINNLITSLYSKEKIYLILEGIIPSKEIINKDLKNVIKKNDYTSRGRLESKEEKLNLLNLTLKKYFSIKISTKYTKSKYPPNYNELIVDKILASENNKGIFDFILNDLLIKDWLEIFLYKKDLKDFDKYNSFDNIKRNKIKENLERIDKYINKIYNKKNENKIYFHCFVLIAYNLYRYLLLKEKRNKNKNDEKEAE